MKTKAGFRSDKCYYIANVGNTGELIFDGSSNYDYFHATLKKRTNEVAEILAWILMSNQYHLVVKVNSGFKLRKLARKKMARQQGRISSKQYSKMISKIFAGLLSGYARAYNKMYHRRGSLFRENFLKIELNSVEEIDLFTRAVLEMQELVKENDHYNHEHTFKCGLTDKLIKEGDNIDENNNFVQAIHEGGIRNILKRKVVLETETEAQIIRDQVEEEVSMIERDMEQVLKVSGIDSKHDLLKKKGRFNMKYKERLRDLKVKVLARKLYLK